MVVGNIIWPVVACVCGTVPNHALRGLGSHEAENARGCPFVDAIIACWNKHVQ